MFLHVGNNKNIRIKNVIGIFDMDTSTISRHTKTLLSQNQKKGKVEYGDDDIPRSFIIYEDKEKSYRIRLSRISTTGLLSRMNAEENSDEWEKKKKSSGQMKVNWLLFLLKLI